MGSNEWKKLWNGRSVNVAHNSENERTLLLELKRSNGFDVVGEGLSYEILIEQYNLVKKMLFPALITENGQQMDQNNHLDQNSAVGMAKAPYISNWYEKSVYEVGCGSGANLYLFERDGFKCGGLDYSENLLKGARQVLQSLDIICEEANHLPEEPSYDALLSNSVFSYFIDEGYAYEVLEKMYKKAKHSIGIIDIHDKEKEQDFIEYRKKTIENYEERYKNLPKLFYTKSFFEEFAKGHGMDIVFTDSKLKGYWNNEFIFHCFMYK